MPLLTCKQAEFISYPIDKIIDELKDDPEKHTDFEALRKKSVKNCPKVTVVDNKESWERDTTNVPVLTVLYDKSFSTLELKMPHTVQEYFKEQSQKVNEKVNLLEQSFNTFRNQSLLLRYSYLVGATKDPLMI